MTLTTDILQDWFTRFNSDYFEAGLRRPAFGLTQAKSYLGQCRCQPGMEPIIRISVFYDRTERELQTTFLHEMIHLWQFQSLRRLGHGDSFKRMASRIYRISEGAYVITRCSRVNPGQLAAVHHARGPVACDVLVWRDRRGVCVARIADGCASSLLAWFRPKHPDCALYHGRGVVFHQFPRSQRRVNFQRFAPAVFESEIVPFLLDW
ncbi:MAG: SprT-like domain-containing protein [Paludibacteraceae bacterium]|nr:SprT-like domain-containing protein [Paludibacteraceae bacterium]